MLTAKTQIDTAEVRREIVDNMLRTKIPHDKLWLTIKEQKIIKRFISASGMHDLNWLYESFDKAFDFAGIQTPIIVNSNGEVHNEIWVIEAPSKKSVPNYAIVYVYGEKE